jgi:hypothetical protein
MAALRAPVRTGPCSHRLLLPPLHHPDRHYSLPQLLSSLPLLYTYPHTSAHTAALNSPDAGSFESPVGSPNLSATFDNPPHPPPPGRHAGRALARRGEAVHSRPPQSGRGWAARSERPLPSTVGRIYGEFMANLWT